MLTSNLCSQATNMVYLSFRGLCFGWRWSYLFNRRRVGERKSLYFSVIVLSVYDCLAFADSREEKHCLFQRECEYRYIFITFIISKKSCTNPQINSITGFNSPKLSQRQQEERYFLYLCPELREHSIRLEKPLILEEVSFLLRLFTS